MFLYRLRPDDADQQVHTFQSKWWSEATTDAPTYHAETVAWCRDQFGRPGPSRPWDLVGWTFYFREAADAFAFKMRWC